MDTMTDLRERIVGAIDALEDKAREVTVKNESQQWYAHLQGKVAGMKLVLDYMRAYEPPHGVVADGFGSEWQRCKADCQLEVVRPGKVQCECDY